MQFLFCRALAERTGSDLCLDGTWVGEDIFDIPRARLPQARATRRFNAVDALSWAQPDFSGNAGKPERRSGGCDAIEVRDYCQHQACMIYTKREAQSWLRLRPQIEEACVKAQCADGGGNDKIVCHRREGDYRDYGYPTCSLRSYARAADSFGLIWDSSVAILTEEDPTPHAGFLPDDLAFMPDFYRMMKAPTLLRGNSSFSWVAALLGNGLVLSPVIDGLEGGREHDVKFVAGNWPRFCNLDFVSDLFVAP